MHVAQRLGPRQGHGPFAGESWLEYVPGVLRRPSLDPAGGPRRLGIAGPGLPLAGPPRRADLERLRRSSARRPPALGVVGRAAGPGVHGERRNAHYAIYALVPWSVWAALGLARLGPGSARGWTPPRLRRGAVAGFAALGLAYGLGFLTLGPWLDRRGVEWAFYEAAGRRIPAGEPVVLLYDDWDRDPYPTPFGPIPHDLAVRLYYLDGRRSWCEAGRAGPPAWRGLGLPVAAAGPPRYVPRGSTSSAASATGRTSSGWAVSRPQCGPAPWL